VSTKTQLDYSEQVRLNVQPDT